MAFNIQTARWSGHSEASKQTLRGLCVSRNVDYYCSLNDLMWEREREWGWREKGRGKGRRRGRGRVFERVPGVSISKNRKNLVSGKKPIS